MQDTDERHLTIVRRRAKEETRAQPGAHCLQNTDERETPYAAQHTVNWRRGEDPCSSYTSLCVSHTVTQQSRKITSQPVNEKRHNNSSKMHCIRPSVGDSVEYTQPHYREHAVHYLTGYHLKPTGNTMCSHHCSLGMTDGRHRCTSSGIPTYCPSSLLPSHVFPVYTRENRHSQRTAIQWLPEVNLIVSLSFEVTRSLYLAHRFLRNHGLTKWPLHFVMLIDRSCS